MRKIFLSVLFLLPSCGIYTKLNEAVERVDLATQEADKALQGMQAGLASMGAKGEELAAKLAEVRVAIAEADKDGDGRVSGLEEWYGLVMQLLTILGVGGYAVSTNAKRRATAQQLYAAIDQLKDKLRETPPAA